MARAVVAWGLFAWTITAVYSVAAGGKTALASGGDPRREAVQVEAPVVAAVGAGMEAMEGATWVVALAGGAATLRF